MNHILCIRSGFAGDICLSTSSLRGIKQKYPDVHLTYACWRQYSELVFSPWVDEVTAPGLYMTSDYYPNVVDFRHESLMDEYPKTYWGQLHAMQCAEKGLLDLDKMQSYRPELYIGPDDQAVRESTQKLVAINTFSTNGVNWRIWSHEKWGELVLVLKSMDYKVVLLGTKSDPLVENVDVDLRGKTRPSQAVGVLAICDLCIGIDSLICHMAHSIKYVHNIETGEVKQIGDSTPTVLLAGPVPPECVVPTDARCQVASYYPDCQGPCNHSFASPDLPICEYENSCMRKLPVELVVEKIEGVVDGSVNRSSN